MKIAGLIARLLLGLEFVFFGLNGLLNFLHMPPPGHDTGGRFLQAMADSHLSTVVAALQVVGGALMLSGYYLPLGTVLLGPVVVMILLFHVLMAPAEIGLALVTAGLWLVVAWSVRPALAGIFAQKVPATPAAPARPTAG